MKIRQFESAEAFWKAFHGVGTCQTAVQSAVAGILSRVREEGDRAVREFTARFDGVARSTLSVTPAEKQGAGRITPEKLAHFQEAAMNIRSFHEEEKKQLTSWTVSSSGGRTGQIIVPLRRVGIYVPGGTAAYPSSVLMNVIPAQVAGVEEIVLVSPPSQESGTINPLVLAVAELLNVRELYAIGGAQAIAALAFGTETIQPVDKITGPGNQYVAEAKRQVFGVVGIDSVAGPSEIMILADDTANPAFLAADLLSQAEHDPEARAVLVSTSAQVLDKTQEQLSAQLPTLPRAEIAEQSLRNRGAFIWADDIEEAIQLVNRVAPEHLELQVARPDRLLSKIRCAGAVFLGKYTPEPVGDYWAGSNHVLPTAGNARFASALSVRDFVRWVSVVEYDRDRLQKDYRKIASFARLEGLEAHARAVEMRFQKSEKS